ncbi:MAG: TonB-dependent receptor [Pseudomonadota bacterium]|nr:TonB-dependent receptor [Pseudomonadota bacterium]
MKFMLEKLLAVGVNLAVVVFVPAAHSQSPEVPAPNEEAAAADAADAGEVSAGEDESYVPFFADEKSGSGAAPESDLAPSAEQPEVKPEAASLDVIAVDPLRAEAPPDLPEQQSAQVLDTIEVTASFRSQDIQDVVGGAHVFSGRALDNAGTTGIEDYLREVPSVSVQKSGSGTAKISMRGISNINTSDLGYAAGSPTTGVYLNDVAIQGSGVFPDLNIYDLSRIEVLKGPQGTLYGEGSMGGAIKLITRQPNPNLWEVRGAVMGSNTSMGDDSYDGRIAVNVPLVKETLGARVVATHRKNGGFVDYVNQDRPDANEEKATSLRGTVLFKPFESIEAEYMYLKDDTHLYQFPVVDPGREEELINSREEDQYSITDFSIHALTLRWNLDFGTLTSVSAVYDTFRDLKRRTPVLQGVLQTQFDELGLTAPEIFSNASTRVVTQLDSVSQELRLVSFGGERINWIAGAFYRDRNQTYDQEKREDSVPEDPTGLFSGLLGGFNPLQGRQEKGFGDEAFEQYSAYGEVTWAAIPGTLEITGGLRGFSEDVSFFIDTDFYGVEAFLIGTNPGNLDPETRTAHIYFEQSLKTRGVLPKLSVGWHLNEDHLAYASVARGFRSGTANIYAALESGPPIVKPDYVWNKEIGLKSTWLGGRLITNVSGYHIDWEDIQGTVLGTARLGIVPTDFAHLDNAGDAVVVGAEASITWLPLDDLVLALNAGYNDAEVTRAREGTGVSEGSGVPNTPRLTWSSTASYNFELGWNLLADMSATYSYVDGQLMVFESTEYDSISIPDFDVIKANIGIRRDQWKLQLLGDNLADKRVITAISAPTPQYTVLTPRTIGLRLSYDF